MYNLPYSDIEIPEVQGMPPVHDYVKQEMARRGESIEYVCVPRIDFVCRPDRELQNPTSLSVKEMMKLFEYKEAMYMTYIPHFLTQAVLYYADLLTESAAHARLDGFKKHTRYLRTIKEEYQRRLRREMTPRIYDKFISQRAEYIEMCRVPLMKMYFTISNALAYKYKHIDSEEVYCYASIIDAVITEIEEFDRQVNDEIAKRLHTARYNYSDAMLDGIKAICKDISCKYPLGKDVKYNAGVSILIVKAKMMINEMIKE